MASESRQPNADRVRDRTARRLILAAAGVIAAAALAAYANSFSGPFLFDDAPSVSQNLTIRHLWPIGPVLRPPSNGALTVAGRPVVNLSLAINFALGGAHVWGYHALNLAIHVLAGLALFGIVRRTASVRIAADTRGDTPDPATLAFLVALLWTVHPLQTESVTYVVQRAESLMGLFYLLTLYCFVRGAACGEDASRRGALRWFALAWLACLLGMGTKEAMASAPVVVLLYDRTFVSGTFREAWRRHRGVHLCLAGTWLLLGFLMVHTGGRGGSAGFGLGVSGWRYALTQCQAVVLYLKLSVWPHPLVIDYGTGAAAGLADVWPQALLVAGLLAGTAWSLVRRPAIGFAGAWFFLILAPTSSIVPIVTQTIAEHRMYLPLAAVIALAVLGIYRLAGRRALVVLAVLAAVLGVMTARRNRDYRSEAAIWSDAVERLPGNPRARYNLGVALGRSHDSAGAIAQYEEALRLRPDDAEAHNNLAIELARIPGRAPDAIAHYEEAVRLKPDNAEAHGNLANELARLPGRMDEAISHYEEALRLKPDDAEAHYDFAVALAQLPGRAPDAIAQYREALRLRPDYAEAHHGLAEALARVPGPKDEVIAQYEEALRLRPDDAEAHNNLGVALARIRGRSAEAIAQYEAALRLRPDYAEAHDNLGVVLAGMPGRAAEAIGHFETSLRIGPGNAEAHYNLANALAGMPGRAAEAIGHYEAALRLKPDFPEAHNNLAVLYAEAGRLDEAVSQAETALRLDPSYREARENLEIFRASQRR